MRTPQRRALLPLSLVAALALSSCGAPNSGPTPEAEQSQAAPAEKTATTRHAEGSHVPTGHVSAHLPSRDPDVLVDRKMVEHSPARDARILTLDRAGALSRTVWALGMGENLIGRDTASDFPGVKDLPLVTPRRPLDQRRNGAEPAPRHRPHRWFDRPEPGHEEAAGNRGEGMRYRFLVPPLLWRCYSTRMCC